MRVLQTGLGLLLLFGVALSGCCPGGAGMSDKERISVASTYMSGYVGDYETVHRQPWDQETSAALVRLGEKGETGHMGDVAGTIVHEYCENLAAQKAGKPGEWEFDRKDNMGHEEFARYAAKQFGAAWAKGDKPATMKEVCEWIVAHRSQLPPSKLLGREIARCQSMK